jgi:hypothetical protein
MHMTDDFADMSMCILSKLYQLLRDNKIDNATFLKHAELKIRLLNGILNSSPVKSQKLCNSYDLHNT